MKSFIQKTTNILKNHPVSTITFLGFLATVANYKPGFMYIISMILMGALLFCTLYYEIITNYGPIKFFAHKIKSDLLTFARAVLLIGFSYFIISLLKSLNCEAIINSIRIILTKISSLNNFEMAIAAVILSLSLIAINSAVTILKHYFQFLLSTKETE
jgi:hypothetical protein